MWGKVSCLRKQHDGRRQASNHRLSVQKSNLLTTTPPRSRKRRGRESKTPNFRPVRDCSSVLIMQTQLDKQVTMVTRQTYRCLPTVWNLKNDFVIFFNHIKTRNHSFRNAVFLQKKKYTIKIHNKTQGKSVV